MTDECPLCNNERIVSSISALIFIVILVYSSIPRRRPYPAIIPTKQPLPPPPPPPIPPPPDHYQGHFPSSVAFKNPAFSASLSPLRIATMGLAPSSAGFAPASAVLNGPRLLTVWPGQKLKHFQPRGLYSKAWHAVIMCRAALEVR